MTWKPTSFCRVFNLPTTVTAEDEGFVALPSPSRTGGDACRSTDSAEPVSDATLTSSLLCFSLSAAGALDHHFSGRGGGQRRLQHVAAFLVREKNCLAS